MTEVAKLLVRGQLALAERSLLDALALDPKATDLHRIAVRLYHDLGEPERAAFHLGRARETDDSARDAARRGRSPRIRLAEALDHLAHGDAAAAADLAGTLLRDGQLDDQPELKLEALILTCEADLLLGNTFRALKAAERAAVLSVPDEAADLLARASRLLAQQLLARDDLRGADAAAAQALAVAAKHGLREEEAEAEAVAGEIARYRGGAAAATAHFQAAATLLREIAAPLGAARERSYLEQPKRARILSLAAAPAALVTTEDAAPALRRAARPNLVRTLSEISGLINSMTNLDAMLERVMDIALEIVGAERGLLILFSPDGTRLDVKVARNIEGGSLDGVVDFSRNVVREAAKGREVVTLDAANDAWASEHKSVMLYSIRSLVCFPLRIQDIVLGAVYLDNQRHVRHYDDADLEFLRAFTNLSAIALENARLMGKLREENLYLQRVATDRFRHSNIIGVSAAMERVFHLVEKAMDSAFPVLITGETGTGKEVITKAIHFGSARKDRSFVAQNCAAIPAELLESEMFGYKRGAFTGADQDKKGLFEIASGGTLLLDEIGELDMALQAKLLRVLQDGTIRRVGETSERRVDVRIIAATNRNLKEAVEQGSFRLDLFYRLNVLQIELPPLRHRREDIPLLAEAFLEKCNKQMGRHFRGFTTEAMEYFTVYDWPGNVRELENAVARSVVFADGDIIDVASLPAFLLEPEAEAATLLETAATTAPAAAEPDATAKAREILARIAAGEDFWAAVHAPFLRRDISRDVAREVVRLGLEASGWKYARMLTTFHLPAGEYRRLMNFLAKAQLKVDRPATDVWPPAPQPRR